MYCKFFVLLLAALPFALTADIVMPFPTGRFILNEENGAIKSSIDRWNRTVLENAQNRYIMMSKAGDVTAYEAQDKVVKFTAGEKDGKLTFVCTNSKLPDIVISKTYWQENNGLRRTLTFTNQGKVKRYILPMTDIEFDKSFKKNLWHLGAGYIGPYKPLPQVETERPVNEYRQSSKGLVLINPDEKLGNFSHYRVKINDTVVLPWWHSTIGHYREYADRLYYTPKGYRMGLGTLDVLPNGGKISVTDCFNMFIGDMFTFFDNIFMKDKEIAAEFKSVPKSPAWIKDIFCVAPMSIVDYTRYLNDMTGEGLIVPLGTPLGDWADYRSKNGYTGFNGGTITAEEFQEFMNKYKAAAPGRAYPVSYGIVVSTTHNTDIYKEHPEWFRRFDRSGSEDSLFPGLANNYQSMFNNAGLRKFFVESLMGYVHDYQGKVIYLDEAQMTNTIDWERDQITRDDHSVLFWRELKKRTSAEDIATFYNGSGQPYADINYMESPHEMRPDLWRNYVGIAWGLGLVNRCIPDMRMIPLYWSRVTDYVNRVLALGWVPAPGVSASIPVMRAVYQTGNTYPFNVKYQPDWKLDDKLEVESYAVQREKSQDIMLSFINRGKSAANIPVSVNLATLGFDYGDDINIWKIDYVYDDKKDMLLLSDEELRKNYREYNWHDGTAMTRTQLVYSGNAQGTFKNITGKLGKDRMCTYLFTKAPAAVYSINDMVQNSFYTTCRQGVIKAGDEADDDDNSVTGDSRIVDFKQPGEVLLISKNQDFTDIKLNGKAVDSRVVDICRTAGRVIKVPAGKHRLTWKSIRKAKAENVAPAAKVQVNDIVCEGNKVITIERNNINVYTGKTPVRLPVQRKSGIYKVRYPGSSKAVTLKVFGGKGTAVKPLFYLFQPAKTQITKVNVKHGNVSVSEKAEHIGRFEDVTGMQQKLSPAIVKADPEKLIITSGTSRRDSINLYHSAWAGLELNNARQIKVRLNSTFKNSKSISLSHIRKGAGKPDTNFAGLIVDFQVNGKYVKRVALSMGLYNTQYSRTEPAWGKANSKADMNLELGDFINNDTVKEFSLDLERLAPENWNGTAYITVGTARILSGRSLSLEILKFNDKDAKDFIHPMLPTTAGKRIKPQDLVSKVLKSQPSSLKKITPAEWLNWTKLEPLQPMGNDPGAIQRSRTDVFMAHDFENIYLGCKLYENRPGTAKFAEVYRNERMEFLLVRPDGKLFQVLADTKGQNAVFINGQMSEIDGVTTFAKYEPNVGTNIFIAIPIELLRFDMQRTPVIVKGNVCRVRFNNPVEYSVWSPMDKGFAERNNYGTIVLHFDGN